MVGQAEQLDIFSIRARGPYLSKADQFDLAGQRLIVFNCLSDGKERSLRQIEDDTGEPQASISARWREIVAMKRWFTEKRRAAPGSRLWLYRIDISRPHVEDAA